MPVLQVSDIPLDSGRRRVEVTWRQDGAAPRAAVSTFAYRAGEQEAEKIRWYLEDYAEFPADPAPVLAADAETRLADLGTGLFGQVFTGQDAAGIWAQAQAQLPRVRVEVDTDPAEAPGLPWELLRDPNTDTPLALGAGEFVRTHLQTAGRVSLPQAAGDQLRVLLVICRPGRGDDVPFRSVASRLVRGGAEKMPGLHLDVLRPATYPRLAEILHQAADAGRPYHVVHFDGHGTYLDLTSLQPGETADEPSGGAARGHGGGGIGLSPLRYGISVAGAVRPGQHGYLIFEDPSSPTNQQLADGPTLGRLLTSTGVPVLVLNACRSAYTEAPPRPTEPGPQPENTSVGSTGEVPAEGVAGLADDVHARIRAYGSLAAEVADTGVPGVVAMRYNVYVVTAAQYAADLYAHLLAGKTLGQAATSARRALADNPDRQIGGTSVALQDWAVPVVYEAAPLTLLAPEQRAAPLIHLTPTDHADTNTAAGAIGGEGMPRPPDAGFYGRDETLLALDRAFDTHPVALLHAYAGAGKTTTAAEFARWYQATGALHHPTFGTGPVLWSTFEHLLPLHQLLDAVGDCFAPVLEANGIHWQALTDPTQRRNLVVQLLDQVPVLWVWDNTEPVTGFPPGTPSAWTQVEQNEIAGFLRDLAQHTQCKVLLTSRRDEHHWLGDLPTRVALPPMPMRERLLFAAELAVRQGHYDPGTDLRPLLRYTAGNPLTVAVLVGQALRDNLTTTEQIQAFVERLRVGEQELEAGEDAALGRSRSLAASLSYGFTHAFTDTERAQLAVLHLFRDTIDADALRGMGDPDIAGDDVVPQLAGLTRDTTIALLDRAAAVGLLTPLGGGYYAIHPALPWYFTTLYTTTYGQPGDPEARQSARAYTHSFAELGEYYHRAYLSRGADTIPTLWMEEANLQNALALARRAQHWGDVIGCLQGLRALYQRTGRTGELTRVVDEIAPDFTDPANDHPLPGRENYWAIITELRVRLALENTRDWTTAARLQRLRIAWERDQAATALATPDTELTSALRGQIRTLAISIQYLGHISHRQDNADCVAYYQEALDLLQRIQDRQAESRHAINFGNVYMTVPGLQDLDQAEQWFRRSLELRASHDRVGQAKSYASLAGVSYERFVGAQRAHQAEAVMRKHINEALDNYQKALNLLPPDDLADLAVIHHQLGRIYGQTADASRALHHFQQSITLYEAHGNIYGAGRVRFDIATLLGNAGRPADALQYARAALHDYERVGPGGTQDADAARARIALLEEDAQQATRK
jgi:tetratricopeptide (TPR) repeat protein